MTRGAGGRPWTRPRLPIAEPAGGTVETTRGVVRVGTVDTEEPLPTDTERLQALCEVLLTVRAKMLGVAEGLKKALGKVPPLGPAHQALSGLVGGLGEIVQHMDSFGIRPGDTALREGLRLGADVGMHGHWSPGGGDGPRGWPAPGSSQLGRDRTDEWDEGAWAPQRHVEQVAEIVGRTKSLLQVSSQEALEREALVVRQRLIALQRENETLKRDLDTARGGQIEAERMLRYALRCTRCGYEPILP